MKFRAALVLILFVTAQAQAGEMWVTSSTLKSQNGLEQLAESQRSQIQDMDLDSLFDVELRSPVPAKVLSALFEKEALARNFATNGDFLAALQQYQELLQKLKLVPNVSGVEKITFSTFIHIAEIETLLRAPDSKKAWLQAHAWDPTEKPSPSEFSPATIKKFLEAPTLRSGTVAIKATDPSLVFVDGKRTKEPEGETYRVHLEPGWHQVAVLAGGASWLTKEISVRRGELTAVTMNPQSLVSGNCENPVYRGDALPRQVRLLADFDGHCQRIYYSKNWYDLAGARIISGVTELSPSPTPVAPLAPRSLSLADSRTLSEKEDHGKRNGLLEAVKSPWVWAGVGILVTGLLIAQSQNQQTMLIPTHNYQ